VLQYEDEGASGRLAALATVGHVALLAAAWGSPHRVAWMPDALSWLSPLL